MYKDHWKKILEAWRNELEVSLDLSNAVRIHLVAEEKGKGEIHRFVAIGASRPSAELVITRMISQLADLKLADHDPTTIQIRAVTWVNRSTALDDLGIFVEQKSLLRTAISLPPRTWFNEAGLGRVWRA